MGALRSTKIRLLLVDDEPEFLEGTARILARRGFDVVTAPDGATALQRLQNDEFDVVVLDVKMAGLDGVEVCRQIAARWPGLPVVVLTGQATLAQSVELTELGAFAHLSKPCDVETLAETARRAAEVERTERPFVLDPEEAARIRVLLCDDEPDFLSGLARTLTRRGFQIATASGGTEALEVLAGREIDVAVLDMKMPGMNGLDLLQRIRAEHPRIQILLLTGHPTLDQAIKGMEEGAVDYLLKPQDVDALALKILCAFHDRNHAGRRS